MWDTCVAGHHLVSVLKQAWPLLEEASAVMDYLAFVDKTWSKRAHSGLEALEKHHREGIPSPHAHTCKSQETLVAS